MIYCNLVPCKQCSDRNDNTRLFVSASRFAAALMFMSLTWKRWTEKHHGSTNLVHLTIGSIANHLHQLKDTCWILEKKKHGEEKLLSSEGKRRGTMQCYIGMGTEEVGQQMWISLRATRNGNMA